MLKPVMASLALFALLLLLVHFVHFRFIPVHVVFYGALLDVAIAGALAALLSWVFCFRRIRCPETFGLLVLVFLLSGYIFAISIPTVIDRSYSMYLLEKLDQQGGQLRQEAFEKQITEEFMREHRLADVRLTEQLESGTVVIENGCVRLTDRGRAIAGFTRWYRLHMLPTKRLLMGQYTDDLTDPFRRPSDLSEYRCE